MGFLLDSGKSVGADLVLLSFKIIYMPLQHTEGKGKQKKHTVICLLQQPVVNLGC